MRQPWIFILLFALLTNPLLYPIQPIDYSENVTLDTNWPAFGLVRLEQADLLFHEHKYREAISLYQQLLQEEDGLNGPIYRKIALCYAALKNLDQSIFYIEQSLYSDFKPNILVGIGFDAIRNTPEFKDLEARFSPNFTFWTFLYLYAAMIGFYITATIQFNKKIDRVAKLLISSFIFIHSFFLLNIWLNITNFHYSFPHSYLMSTCFSFLYGPLLYFYFKRITQQHAFKKRDLLHLIPTVLLLAYLVPIYAMSGKQKLGDMFQRIDSGLNAADSEYLSVIVLAKLISLVVYGYFVWRIYRIGDGNKSIPLANKNWQKNIYFIHMSYVATYAAYGILITNQISSGFFYHSQIACMSFMVLFLGYSANVQPSVFSGIYSFGNHLFFKYEKSGLTESLSKELKENLLRLFDIEKIYKENDISLESLAEKLNTTRHNASQVINEHFNMNFHELVNKYRIQEAKYILHTDAKKSLNIIDVAYEVGFNNKVTFNKAFKKDTQLTPSEYQRITFQV